MDPLKFCLFFILIPVTEAGVVGTFFWKPRVGLDLTVPTTEARISPVQENVRNGIEVIVQGYHVGITLVAVAVGLDDQKPNIYLDPTRAHFYTNAYRWAKRYISMLPPWLGGNSTYSVTHRVWNQRHMFKEEFMPKWMRYLFPYVAKEDWEGEEDQFRRFKKYSETAFTKHYRFPSKHFNNFRSEETQESIEDVDDSVLSSLNNG